MKIALFIIATGDYIKYVYPLYDSIKKYFLNNYTVDVFVFTNDKEVPKGTISIYELHEPFPYPTLMRYHFFVNHQLLYKDYDYYYYCDADMEFISEVGSEIFGDVVAVCHPGFYCKKCKDFSYEKNIISSAYVQEGERYYAGGFNGGRNFLKMSSILKTMVDIDLSKNFIACWHDESYLNKYLSLYPPDVILDPSYCYPEQKDLAVKWGLNELKPKLIALNKNK